MTKRVYSATLATQINVLASQNARSVRCDTAVTKGSIFLRAVLFFCASDISLSENLISERCFSTILAG